MRSPDESMIVVMRGALVSAGFEPRRAAMSGKAAPMRLAHNETSGSEMATTTPTCKETMRVMTPTSNTTQPSAKPQSAPTAVSFTTARKEPPAACGFNLFEESALMT